jgi:hypothetical protein
MIATDKGREKKFKVWTTFVLVQVQHPKPLKPRRCMYKINPSNDGFDGHPGFREKEKI